MDLAKPGLIHLYCLPNALTTFKEYLVDYGTEETRELGERVILQQLEQIPSAEVRQKTLENLKRIEAGDRDLYL